VTGFAPLAYVFWHAPASADDVAAYEADLLDFHASLTAAPPPGFIRSETFGLPGASWLAGPGPGYEDWYLVNDWAAIGELNRAAVATAHVASHDRIAHQAASGSGAIYQLHAGSEITGSAVRIWFAKPAGWGYGRLDEALAPMLGDGGSLWRRQMVLGPAPEFCLRSDAAPTLPEGIAAEVIDYHALP
jgi:hypothetical protein